MESPNTTIDEINDGIFRISTWIPDVTPVGFTFNQFLVVGDEPLIFHTGARGLFPLVAEAMSKVVPVESLRWITFGHVESDECDEHLAGGGAEQSGRARRAGLHGVAQRHV
jgi:flavorubredoxin